MKENEKTLRRFWEASHCNGAHNVVGLAYSIHELGKAMMEAGSGTQAIADDPAIRKIISALAMAANVPPTWAGVVSVHESLGDKRQEIMSNPDYAAIMNENGW